MTPHKTGDVWTIERFSVPGAEEAAWVEIVNWDFGPIHPGSPGRFDPFSGEVEPPYGATCEAVAAWDAYGYNWLPMLEAFFPDDVIAVVDEYIEANA